MGLRPVASRYEGNQTPKLTSFGFQFLLLFVLATIPTGLISKETWGLTLADVDWLHGAAESLLTGTIRHGDCALPPLAGAP